MSKLKGIQVKTTNVIGRKFIILDKEGGHNYPLDTVLTFKRNFTNTTQGTDMAAEVPGGNTVFMRSCYFLDLSIPNLKLLIKENLKRIEEIENENKSLKEKIKFCEEEGLNEFSEIAFRVKETLNILKTRSSEKEILQDITKLISNEITV